MDGLAVSLTTQVEEQGGLTTCLPHCIEVSATYVKLKEKQESTGEKADFLASTDVNNTKQKWQTEKNPTPSQNILLFTTLMNKATLRTSRFKWSPFSRNP